MEKLIGRGERFWAALVVGAIAVGGAAIASTIHLRRTLSAITSDIAALARNERLPAASTIAQRDLPWNLPTEFDSRLFVDILQAVCTSSQVKIESLSIWQAAPSQKVLGRIGVSVEFRGNYPHLKLVMSEALYRVPNLMIRSVSFKRSGSSAEIQAHIEFVALLRPSGLPAPVVSDHEGAMSLRTVGKFSS